jgi:molybdate transport system substrate-binding protein
MSDEGMKTLLISAICMLSPILHAGEIMVFAAASLTNALKEIATAHEKASGDKVRFNFAASSTLAQQIVAGAPADVFFSADEAKMDLLVKQKLIVEETIKPLLGNTLVVVTALDGPVISKVEDLAVAKIRRISIGDPKAVPVGVYAKSYLEGIKLWDAVAPKVVPSENVRASLAVVESGNVDAGVVYKTDAAISKTVKVAWELPAAEVPKIVYPVALLKDSRKPDAAWRFLTFLEGPEADEVFKRLGFIILEQGPNVIRNDP